MICRCAAGRCVAGVLPVFCRCSAGVLLVAALVANGTAMAQRQRAAAVVAARAACLQTWAAPSWLGLHTHERAIAVVLAKAGKRRQWQWRSNSGVAAVVRQMAQLRRNSGSVGSSRTEMAICDGDGAATAEQRKRWHRGSSANGTAPIVPLSSQTRAVQWRERQCC